MALPSNCPLAPALAARLRKNRDELTRRWLERIAARVTVEANRLFPTDELLDHVPLIIDGIASYVEDPAEDVGTDPAVVAKAMELGAMRHEQGFDAYQILKEYEILGGVLFRFLAGEADGIDVPCSRAELLHCGHRVFHAVALIQQATAMQFLQNGQRRVRDREERLRRFNRMVSHELKNRLGAAGGALGLLEESWLDEAQRQRFLVMVKENVDGMQVVLDDLVELSRLEENVRQQRNVRLTEAVGEVRRRLREFARSRSVTIEVDGTLPRLEVNAAAVELCLTNYISNAIKYSDASKAKHWVQIRAHLAGLADSGTSELIIEVSDNGLGVPADAQEHLFERFFRAHDTSNKEVEGLGLGLSIVRETIEQLGGRVWWRPREGGGSVFAFALPSRRQPESVSVGIAATGSASANTADDREV
jgi:signal transduction histidine kinase